MTDQNDRTALTTLFRKLERLESTENAQCFRGEATPDWRQGRAVYGGLTVALSLRVAKMAYGDLPPLRSVVLTFIGPPASEDLQFSVQKVREGKSATFVDVKVTSDAQPIASISFVFGAARASAFHAHWAKAPAVSPPADCFPFFEIGGAPNFAQQFNSRFAGGQIPASGAQTGDVIAWLQHKDTEARDTTEGLLCLADGLPPAAMTLMQGFSPVSSMTWMFDIVGDVQSTDDGWWLCRSTCDAVGEGYSSQHMGIWNTAGEPVVLGRQNCVIFA